MISLHGGGGGATAVLSQELGGKVGRNFLFPGRSFLLSEQPAPFQIQLLLAEARLRGPGCRPSVEVCWLSAALGCSDPKKAATGYRQQA